MRVMQGLNGTGRDGVVIPFPLQRQPFVTRDMLCFSTSEKKKKSTSISYDGRLGNIALSFSGMPQKTFAHKQADKKTHVCCGSKCNIKDDKSNYGITKLRTDLMRTIKRK